MATNKSTTGSTTAQKSYDTNYNKGNGYTKRETAYTWNDNGTNKTTYSNATNYEDARAEAVKNGALSSDAKLSSAVTYNKGSAGDSNYNSAESSDKNGNYRGSDKIYSASKPSGTSYANALSNEMAAAKENNMNSNYNSALSDLYKYYNGLDNSQKNYLKGTTNSELVNYLNQIDAGYLKPSTTTGTTSTGTQGTSLADIAESYKASMNGTGTATSPYGNTTATPSLNVNNGLIGTQNGNGVNLNSLIQQYYKPTELNLPEYTGLSLDDIQGLYGNLVDNMQDTQNGYLKALKQNYQNAVADQNENYEAQARANYLNFLANQNNAKLSLNASGAKGGLGQTLLSNIANNYATNANTAASDNQKALRNLLADYNTTYAETANNFNTAMSSLQQSMIGYLQSAAQAENSYNQWVAQAQMSATAEDRNYALQMAQASLDQYNADRQAAQEAYEYSQNMQYQLEKDSLSNAYKAAEIGDYSQLKALGYDTSTLERENNPTSNVSNGTARRTTSYGNDNETGVSESTNKTDDRQKAVNDALSVVYDKAVKIPGLTQEQLVGLMKQVRNAKNITDEEYNNWANSR